MFVEIGVIDHSDMDPSIPKFDYAGVVLAEKIDELLVEKALNSVKRGGKLDILVTQPPHSIFEVEEIARKLYGFAPPRPQELDFTVLFYESHHTEFWQHTFSEREILPRGTSSIGVYQKVAVGGTWDHLHWGHKLMLTLATYTAKSTVVVGVTDAKLLTNKKHAEALEDYNSRAENVVKFIRYLKPDIRVEVYSMDDIYGPTITLEGIEALVVSAETSQGGLQVNKKRKEMNWPALEILEAGLIPGHGETKLSSTDLRKEQLEKQGRL